MESRKEYVKVVKVYWNCHSVREDLLEAHCEIFLEWVEGFLWKAVEEQPHLPACANFI